MTTQELLRGFFALLFAGIVALGIYQRRTSFFSDEPLPLNRRCAPIVGPLLLPIFLIALYAALRLRTDRAYTLKCMQDLCLGIFPLLFVYYAVLTAVSPLLRRCISARACAALWLLPNFLYISQQSFLRLSAPKHIIFLRGGWLRPVFLIWAAGAAAVLLWRVIAHLCYRRKLLAGAQEETDPETLALWEGMQKSAGLKKPHYRLVRSPRCVSPLSVGLTWPGIRVVLPSDAVYTPEELTLILRHELVHILRCDTRTKLFLTICTAMCWFNPLQWIAMRRAAEDLELSCDELVLEDADEGEKRRYADLILRTAGDERGFTSCLSASARGMRYRLRQIMTPGKRVVGGITAGVVFLLLLIASGRVAYAYDENTLGALLPESFAQCSYESVIRGSESDVGSLLFQSFVCEEPEKLLDYVCGLSAARITGVADYDEAGEFLDVILTSPEGLVSLSLGKQAAEWVPFGNRGAGAEIYYLTEAPDWDYIDSLLREVEYDPIPQPQNLEIFFFGDDYMQSDPLVSTGMILENTLNGEPSEKYSHWEATCCVIEGAPVTDAEFRFSDGLMPTVLTVTAQNWERTDAAVTLTPEARGTYYLLHLLPESAHYTAEVLFEFGTDLGDQVYRMRYEFDVERPEQ